MREKEIEIESKSERKIEKGKRIGKRGGRMRKR